MTEPLKPTSNLISRYLNKWKQFENYRIQETSLGLLFHSLCPENNKIEHVLLKVSVLNDFYSTNILDTYSVAKHILNKNIDIRLKENDYSLVNDIAQVSVGKAQIPINLYSFASKYCNHHNPDNYPIFDQFIEKMLWHYHKVDGFCASHEFFGLHELKRALLREYEYFVEVIKTFQNFYKLEKHSLREIDIFLWLAGKEWFPKNYKRGIKSLNADAQKARAGAWLLNS